MAFRRKTKFSKKNKKFAKKKATAKKSSFRKSVKKIVKSEIDRNTEDKFRYTLTTNTMTEGSTGFDADNILRLDPCLANGLGMGQGTGRVNRVGNKINVKKVLFKMKFHPADYDAVSNAAPCPLLVRWWVFYDMRNPTDTPAPATTADWNFGGVTDTIAPMFFDIQQENALVNTAKYKILKTGTFKVGAQNSTSLATEAAVPTPNWKGWTNNDIKLYYQKTIDVTKFCRKVIRYADNVDSDPENITHGVWIMFLPMRLDFTTGTNGQYPLEYEVSRHFYFEDA